MCPETGARNGSKLRMRSAVTTGHVRGSPRTTTSLFNIGRRRGQMLVAARMHQLVQAATEWCSQRYSWKLRLAKSQLTTFQYAFRKSGRAFR